MSGSTSRRQRMTALVEERPIEAIEQLDVMLRIVVFKSWLLLAAVGLTAAGFDAVRRKQADKHGGSRQRVELGDRPAEPTGADERRLALDAALTRFAAEDATAARVVELRHFGGLSIEDAAATLGLSRTVVYLHLKYARAWLGDAISKAGSG